jgi:hypothetical protein
LGQVDGALVECHLAVTDVYSDSAAILLDFVKLQTCAKMPHRDLTLASRIVLLEQLKSQLPISSHSQIADITGVSESTITHVIQQQEKL